MTLAGLIWRNLGRRPVRTALTSAGVALGVALIVALLSVAAGAKATAAQLIHIGRANFGIFQAGVPDLTQSKLPSSLAAEIDRVPGIAATARVYLYVTNEVLVYGLDPSEFAAKQLVILHGSRGPGALVGDKAAARLHLEPGSTLRIGTRAFKVAGIFHSGDAFEDSGVVLPLGVVQQLAGEPDSVTTIGVQVTLGTKPNAMAHELEQRFPGTTAVTEPGQVVKIDTSSRLVVETGWIVSLLALIVGGIAVANTMATSVFERVREIGILRAVGWPGRRIGVVIMGEAIAICLFALAGGLLLGWAGAEVFAARSSASPLLHPDFTPGVFAWGLGFALGVGVLGAVWPAWHAAKMPPIEALRRE